MMRKAPWAFILLKLDTGQCIYEIVFIDPRDWCPESVKRWARWIAQEFSIPALDESNFNITGVFLCSLRKDEFLKLCPPFVGEILWEHLDRLQSGKDDWIEILKPVFLPCLTGITF